MSVIEKIRHGIRYLGYKAIASFPEVGEVNGKSGLQKEIEEALKSCYGHDLKISWHRGAWGVSVAAQFVDGLKGKSKYMATIEFRGVDHFHLLRIVSLAYFRLKERITEVIDDR